MYSEVSGAMHSDFDNLPYELGGRTLGLVMAAGFSRRFGGVDKRTLRLADGVGLLEHTLAQLRPVFTDTSGASLLAVVIRPDDCPTALGIPDDCHIVRAPNARCGLGASISDGMTAVREMSFIRDIDSVAILLGDMPALQPAILTKLLKLSANDAIVRPRFNMQCGHPVVFGRKFWPALYGLTGDEGARQVIAANVSALTVVDVDDPGTLLDIDTRGAFDRHWQGNAGMTSNLFPAAQD
ncbi:nucleotidyltransferase family protein [Microbulbifer pacificus]|uniref:Nucleotidyltransferase family protein n=1 Tax=Microbulbifer pacificus TaxID=407164 RepID=A0AAU0MX44_9GAMM|nr:nucleotidyltransferase family protein [Microbulbifer pacificus]WOX04770.1 nucleotidyltransferase family protein [Microbulbifer pacificus]